MLHFISSRSHKNKKNKKNMAKKNMIEREKKREDLLTNMEKKEKK